MMMKCKAILFLLAGVVVLAAVSASATDTVSSSSPPPTGADDNNNATAPPTTDDDSSTTTTTTTTTTAKPPPMKTGGVLTEEELKKKQNERKALIKAKKEIQIPGQYELVSSLKDKQFNKYLRAMEYDDDARDNIRASKTILAEISKTNSSHWSLKRVIITPSQQPPPSTSPQPPPTDKTATTEAAFASGKEFFFKLLDFREKKATITVDDSTKMAHVKIDMGNFTATMDLDFSLKGFDIVFKAKDVEARMEFRRGNAAEVAFKPVKDFFEQKFSG